VRSTRAIYGIEIHEYVLQGPYPAHVKASARVPKQMSLEHMPVMKRLDLLKQISFGVQVAEDEVNELASYFVETNQWARIAKGDIDIVRGEKGAGKSAIYSLLITKVGNFFDQDILLVAAENPRGAERVNDFETPGDVSLVSKRV
jgi:hypothetical protein